MFTNVGAHSFSIEDKINRIIEITKLFIIPIVVLTGYRLIRNITKSNNNFVHAIVILLLFAYPFFAERDYYARYSTLVTLTSFVGIVEYLILSTIKSDDETLIFMFIMTPLCIAGVLTGLTSANGAGNICVGISPCVIFTLYILYNRFTIINPNSNYFKVIYIFLSFICVIIMFNTIYGENEDMLINRVQSGPYKGIYTSEEKMYFLDELENDLQNPIIKNKKTILCYYNFPVGYMYKFKNSFYSTWIINWFMTADSYDRLLALNNERVTHMGRLPDIILKYKYNDPSFIGVPYDDNKNKYYDPLIELFKIDDKHYTIYKQRKEYLIYLKK